MSATKFLHRLRTHDWLDALIELVQGTKEDAKALIEALKAKGG